MPGSTGLGTMLKAKEKVSPQPGVSITSTRGRHGTANAPTLHAAEATEKFCTIVSSRQPVHKYLLNTYYVPARPLPSVDTSTRNNVERRGSLRTEWNHRHTRHPARGCAAPEQRPREAPARPRPHGPASGSLPSRAGQPPSGSRAFAQNTEQAPGRELRPGPCEGRRPGRREL